MNHTHSHHAATVIDSVLRPDPLCEFRTPCNGVRVVLSVSTSAHHMAGKKAAVVMDGKQAIGAADAMQLAAFFTQLAESLHK